MEAPLMESTSAGLILFTFFVIRLGLKCIILKCIIWPMPWESMDIVRTNKFASQKSPFGRNSSQILTMDDAFCAILTARNRLEQTLLEWSRPQQARVDRFTHSSQKRHFGENEQWGRVDCSGVDCSGVEEEEEESEEEDDDEQEGGDEEAGDAARQLSASPAEKRQWKTTC